MLTKNYFYDLKLLAAKDLSQAHVKQHTVTAKLVAELTGFPANGVGSFSSNKPNDTLKIVDNTVTGRKHWVSNITNSDWGVFSVSQLDRKIIIFVDLKNAAIEMVPTLGMEATLTGNIDFKKTPIIHVCNDDHPIYQNILQNHYVAFLTNHYGLAQSLFEDIDQYTSQSKIDCNYEKEKIKLTLSVMNLLWVSAVDEVLKEISNNSEFWSRNNIQYAFAKKCLLDVIHLVTEVTGSSIYNHNQPQHQRYRDALIYSSHMKNLYSSMRNVVFTQQF